jgi:hypothetical protein
MAERRLLDTTTTRDSEWLGQLLSGAIADTLATRGAHLEPLHWSVRLEAGELYVRGTPGARCERPLETCRDWARALELFKQEFDGDEQHLVWFLYSHPWMIEVVCDTPA